MSSCSSGGGLLREINRRYGTAFVIVTHNEGLAAPCDRLVRLVDGRLVSDTAAVHGRRKERGYFSERCVNRTTARRCRYAPGETA